MFKTVFKPLPMFSKQDSVQSGMFSKQDSVQSGMFSKQDSVQPVMFSKEDSVQLVMFKTLWHNCAIHYVFQARQCAINQW